MRLRPFIGGISQWRQALINFFNINFLALTRNTRFGGPGKKFMCLISWERTQKRDPHKLFREDFGDKKGPPNGPFSATKSLVYCFIFCQKGLSPGFRATRLSRRKKKRALSGGSLLIFLCLRPKRAPKKSAPNPGHQ